jgi:probable HAF family extracellular repeat protein
MQTKKGNKVNKLALMFISLMLFGISLPSSAWAEYTYTEIIPPGWEGASAFAINNGGDVVGDGWDHDANNHVVEKGFLYSGGNYTEIIPPGWLGAYAYDINNSGAIVGSGNVDPISSYEKGFLYSGGNYTEIIPPGWTDAGAYAINNGGDIVGYGMDANYVAKGFLYSGGNYTEIIPPGWLARACDINDGGDVVGWGEDANYVMKGFLYSGGNYTEIIPPGWYSARLNAINDGGDILGYGATYSETMGFLYSGGNYTEIIPPGWTSASARAINNGGDIVGGGRKEIYMLWRKITLWAKGFLYSGGNYTDIIPPHWEEAYARAINDNGTIVGSGIDTNDVWKGFIATLQSVCTTWSDVLAKYQAYKNGQATFGDVIECYIEWREHSPLGQ